MPLLGAHMSIQGGIAKAFLRGKETGCRVIQLFTRNANRWSGRGLTFSEIDAFQTAREKTSIEAVSAHNSYLVNLASPLDELREKSLHAMTEEMGRCHDLGIPYLVIHPGSHMGEGEAVGLGRISEGLNRVFDRCPDYRVMILLETTAGQGTSLGGRFEHLATILGLTEARERLGVCLDTCHVFAAGYDMRTADSYRGLMEEFDAVIGLERLKILHVNDAKKEFGSRVDRHEHIGEGFIGSDAFTFFLKDPNFKNTPFLIETPKGRDDHGTDWDVKNLSRLQCLMEAGRIDDCV
jgi:deoxyribonuclease IV